MERANSFGTVAALYDRARPDPPAALAAAIELPDASVDLVSVSSAWHWFAQPAATLEIARVLRDGGRVVVLGNGLDRRQRASEVLMTLREAEEVPAGRRAHEAAEDLSAGPFEDVTALDLAWSWTRDLDQLRELMATYSAAIALSPERRATLLDEISSQVAPLCVDGRVEVGMRVRGTLARRQAR